MFGFRFTCFDKAKCGVKRDEILDHLRDKLTTIPHA